MEQSGAMYLLRNPRTDVIKNVPDNVRPAYTKHFTQGEDFFLRLPVSFRVPSFPIHHDVGAKKPLASYERDMTDLIGQLSTAVPEVFAGLSWIFDPTDTLKPLFVALYRVEDQNYLYLLRVDLSLRYQYSQVLLPGTNDFTAVYETSCLFVESDLIPIAGLTKTPLGIEFRIHQSISDTWIGETGRGYFVQGIWLDRELTRFFSRLFTPPGKKLYPHTPFNCKFRSVCSQVIRLEHQGRKQSFRLGVSQLEK